MVTLEGGHPGQRPSTQLQPGCSERHRVFRNPRPRRARPLPSTMVSRNAPRLTNDITARGSLFDQHRDDGPAKLGQKRHLHGRRRTTAALAPPAPALTGIWAGPAGPPATEALDEAPSRQAPGRLNFILQRLL